MKVSQKLQMREILQSIKTIKYHLDGATDILDPRSHLDMDTRVARFQQIQEVAAHENNRHYQHARNFMTHLNNLLRPKSAERQQELVVKFEDLTNTPSIIDQTGVKKIIINLEEVEPTDLQINPPMSIEKNMARLIHISKQKGENVEALHGEIGSEVRSLMDCLGTVDNKTPQERMEQLWLELRQRALAEKKNMSEEGFEVDVPNIEIPQEPVPLSPEVQNFDWDITPFLNCDPHEFITMGGELFGGVLGFDTSILQRLVICALLKIVQHEPAAVCEALRNCSIDVPFVEVVDHYVPCLRGLLTRVSYPGFLFFPNNWEETMFGDEWPYGPERINRLILDLLNSPHTTNIYEKIFTGDEWDVPNVAFMAYPLYPMLLPMLCAMKALCSISISGPYFDFNNLVLFLNTTPELWPNFVHWDFSTTNILVSEEVLNALQQGNYEFFENQKVRELMQSSVNRFGLNLVQTPEFFRDLDYFLILSKAWFYYSNQTIMG